MADDITTDQKIEALLEGQRQLSSLVAELSAVVAGISRKQDEFAGKVDALAGKVDALDGKVDALAGKQDQLDARVTALTREVRDGFDEYNRRIRALNERLLSFETWLSRIDDRLHDEITARTR